MEQIITALTTTDLAAAVREGLYELVTLANGKRRRRTLSAEETSQRLAGQVGGSPAGLEFEYARHVGNSYGYRAYATTVGCAWAQITLGGTEYYVARLAAAEVAANGSAPYAFSGGSSRWTALGAVLGITRGEQKRVGLTTEDTGVDLDQLLVRCAAKGIAPGTILGAAQEISNQARAISPRPN